MHHLTQVTTYIPLLVATATATAIPNLFDKRQFHPQCDPRTGGLDRDSCNIAWLQIPTTGNVELWTTSQSLLVPNFNGPNNDLTSAQTWQSGQCSIALWMPDGRNWDFASWSDVDQAARSIIDGCVGPQRSGGRVTLGGQRSLQVVVFQDSEDDDDTTDTDPDPTCPLDHAERYQDVTDCFLGGIAIGSGGGGKKARMR